MSIVAQAVMFAPSDWAQFGLAGVVIAALFWLVVSYGKRQDVQEAAHRDERREWRESEERRTEKLEAALNALTEALRNG